ncbi:MAG TPA: DUF4382 domain-containing protein [Burkholderiaceae bacterium]|nr:DUF4382 domain-containing protein [Burkholderiaceae bacterium]
MKHRNKIFFTATAVSAAVMLTACGSGGSSGSTSPAPMGTVNVAVTDAPTKDFDHVWVTVSEIRFHTSIDANTGDPGWLKFPLTTPVTLDLAALDNGALSAVFNGLSLPAGTYQQIRLLLVADTDPLSNSAQAQGLTYNDQVNWTDASNVSHLAPLEIAAPRQGISLDGTFTAATGATLNLVVDFDVGHDVVHFLHGGNDAFTLKPNLRYFDLAQAGAVTGSVDTTNLCTTATTGCAFNLVIKSEELSADGSHHNATRFTTIRSDGSFTLFPLRVPAGQTSTSIDVLVRGRDMETILVRGVPVVAGTTPSSSPTQVSATPLPLTIGTEYTANAASAVAPTGAWVNFYQTLSSTGQAEVPYEVRYRHLDPFTGTFFQDIPLSLGPIHVGAYVAGGSPTLAANTPVESAGGFLVFAGDLAYTRTEASSDPLVPGTGSPTLFTMPALTVDATVATADSISGTILQATANTYDKGELVVVRMGTIVTTQPLDAVLAANGGTGGTYTVANLPGGSAAKTVPGAYYYLYARVWNSGHPLLTLRRVDFNGFADLRTGSATGINATLN